VVDQFSDGRWSYAAGPVRALCFLGATIRALSPGRRPGLIARRPARGPSRPAGPPLASDARIAAIFVPVDRYGRPAVWPPGVQIRAAH
jgi:hypothetical protein